LALLSGSPLCTADDKTFERVMNRYEPIRLALLGDSMDGVNENGRAIAAELLNCSTGRWGVVSQGTDPHASTE
jgi:hypothetical protein